MYWLQDLVEQSNLYISNDFANKMHSNILILTYDVSLLIRVSVSLHVLPADFPLFKWWGWVR